MGKADINQALRTNHGRKLDELRLCYADRFDVYIKLFSMKTIPCSPEAVAAVWAISSPETVAAAPLLPNSSGWKELRGSDTWVYMRLTKPAARALAEQLLYAVASTDPEVVTGRPQGLYAETPSEERFGFFLHPHGASLTIEVADMPAVNVLLKKEQATAELLSPQPGGVGPFER